MKGTLPCDEAKLLCFYVTHCGLVLVKNMLTTAGKGSSPEKENCIWQMHGGYCRCDGCHLSGPGSRCQDGVQSTGEVFWCYSFPGYVCSQHPNIAYVFFFVPLILCHCWVNDIPDTGYGGRGAGRISFTSLSAFRKQVIQLLLTLVGHALQHGLISRGAA